MNRSLLVALLVTLALTVASLAVTSDETDTFDFDLEGWGPEITGVERIPAGGPLGDKDPYLRASNDLSGRGDLMELAIFNEMQWSGDYEALGDEVIVAIDVANFGGTDLSLRLGIERGESRGEQFQRWVTTVPAVVPAATRGTWSTVMFTLSEAEMSQVAGTLPFSNTLGNVGQLRLLNAEFASWSGDSTPATVGFDNVRIAQTPVELQSFSVE